MKCYFNVYLTKLKMSLYLPNLHNNNYRHLNHLTWSFKFSKLPGFIRIVRVFYELNGYILWGLDVNVSSLLL